MPHVLSRLTLACALLASPARAQAQPTEVLAPRPLSTLTPAGLDAAAQPAGPAAADEPPPPDVVGAKRFLRDVGRDYGRWFTFDTTRTFVVGTAVTMFVRPADEALTERRFDELGDSLGGGQQYGNPSLQFPLAIGWWAMGATVGPRHAEAGRDLLRAQISAGSATYVIKYTVRRTRPNGDPRSFPSGHASATFATAAVLQHHYGWKLGLPFYALGVYTAASRIHDRKHWLSDTVMGATVGITAARVVTFRVKQRPVQVVPGILPGGAMMQFMVQP
jgi:hypothetical protein